MKFKVLAFTIATVLLIAGTFQLLKKSFTTLAPNSYEWENVVITFNPPDENLAARWGTTEATREQVFARSPQLKEKKKLENDLAQIAYDSQYYFDFLTTAQTIILEKLAQGKSIPPYEDADVDFAEWIHDQRIAEANLKPEQVKTIKMDLEDKYKKKMLKQILAKEIKGHFEIFEEPSDLVVEWASDGIATTGNPKAKATALFICNMSSPVCFKALAQLQTVMTEYPLKINYRPAPSDNDIYGNLRQQVGLCVAKIDAQKFWDYFDALKVAASNTEEPALYELTGVDKTQMNQCMVSAAMNAEWEAHKKFFGELWKAAIPALIINGEPILGPFSLERVTELVARRGR